MGRLLFVDDDALVLRGLERALRVQRLGFECVFLDDPVVALGRLEDLQPDAVISDMVMPGLDGAAFLAEAARRRPTMARFVLSGEVGAGSLVRMAAAAHQCLAKPCRAEVLADVLRRTVGDAGARPDGLVRAGLYQIPSLPVPATQIERLRHALGRPGGDVEDAQTLAAIEASPGVAMKLLQIACWAGLGVEAPPVDVRDAFYRLGTDAVVAMLDSNLLTSVAAAEATQFQHDTWQRAAAAATTARLIATEMGLEADAACRAVLAAAWSGVGPLVLDAVSRDTYARVLNVASTDEAGRAALEREAFGVTASEALTMLLRLWGLPGDLIELVGRSRAPAVDSDVMDDAAVAETAIAVVAALADGTGAAPGVLARPVVADRVDAWRAAARLATI